MNPYAVLIGALILSIGWLVSEFFAERAVRISLGLLCIFVGGAALATVAEEGPRQKQARTNSILRAALEEMERTVEEKHYELALKALKAYNSTYSNERIGGPESAAIEMQRVLRSNN